ncbi:MAG TPA: hypothetical protein VG458_10710 [Solirubrobacterales bacterium]|nr:hypothetical protein [Solirubrobacterales bacterium]
MSGFARTAEARVAAESGIYVPNLPGLTPEKVALADGVAQLARFQSPAGFDLRGIGFDISDGGTATNEVQKVAIKATGGSAKWKVLGEDTALIAWNADAAAVQAAIVATTAVVAGAVEVTGGPGDEGGTTPYVITFKGALAGQNIPAITVGAGLTGGEAKGVITTQTPGESVRVDVGIYGADLKRLASNGGTAVAATAGAKALDLTASLRIQPGTFYYAAFASQGGAAKALHMVSADAPVADLLGATAGKRELVTLAAAGYPLPKTIAVGARAGTKVPLMALRTIAAS